MADDHGPHLVANWMLRYGDAFNLKRLYKDLHYWLAEEDWKDSTGSSDHKFMETLYMERHHQKSIHGGGKEFWIYWRLWKYPESKYSKFYKWTLDIDYHCRHVQDVEIMHEGKKISIQEGEFEIIIRAKVHVDYNQAWHHHRFLKDILTVFTHRVVTEDIRRQKKALWRDAYKVHGWVKNFMTLTPVHPTPINFLQPRVGVSTPLADYDVQEANRQAQQAVQDQQNGTR